MSLRGRFYLGFSLIALLAVGVAAYGVHALSATVDLIVRLYDEPLMGVNYARAASATLNEAHRLMDRSLLVTPDPASNVVASLRKMQTDIAEDLQIVRQRVHDDVVTSALDRAEKAIAEWFGSGTTILEPRPGGVTALPMPAVIERQSAAAVSSLDDLVELVAANGFSYRLRAGAAMRTSSATLAGLAGGIIAMSALFALLFGHLLIRPIRAATRIAEAVAAGNNADVVATTRRDEIGRLMTSLATMQINLRGRETLAMALLREKEETAETLQRVNLHFHAALNNMSQGLIMCDADARVVIVNRQCCDIFGIDPERVVPGTAFRDVLALSAAAGNHPGRDVDDVYAEQELIFRSGSSFSVVKPLSCGKTIAISYEPMPDGGWIATQEDITARRKSEEQVVFLARHDALTRLPNRVTFHERLKRALARAERGKGLALLYLDLDQFKEVNDTLGHPTGDSLLCAVASRLADAVRDTDTVARLGGDEFAIVQVDVSNANDTTVLARRIVQAVSQPYDLEGHRIVIGVSIGIALAQPGGGVHQVQLTKNADFALYRAKHDGRGTWRFFEPAMDAAVKARRVLELDLSSALRLGQFELHYQPLVGCRGRMVTGFEALLRWRHPTRGMVQPSEFISVAEEIGIIEPIGAWVLHQACAEAATWAGHLTLAVNLSPLQFRGQNLVGTVADALRTSGIEPERLELEITESVRLLDDQRTVSILHSLRELGVRFALDDFGTGYSSLSYLRCFPFDTIKIDRSFVSELPARDDCVTIVRTIVALASGLHMDTTAEGVETEEQFEFLAAAGCTAIQGYLFSRPLPAGELPALIARLSERVVPELFHLAILPG
jgi:diguanylate cyclase (GGDEF)-like protein